MSKNAIFAIFIGMFSLIFCLSVVFIFIFILGNKNLENTVELKNLSSDSYDAGMFEEDILNRPYGVSGTIVNTNSFKVDVKIRVNLYKDTEDNIVETLEYEYESVPANGAQPFSIRTKQKFTNYTVSIVSVSRF